MCLLSGGVEVEVQSMEVLNDISRDLPFLPSSKGLSVRYNALDTASQVDCNMDKPCVVKIACV